MSSSVKCCAFPDPTVENQMRAFVSASPSGKSFRRRMGSSQFAYAKEKNWLSMSMFMARICERGEWEKPYTNQYSKFNFVEMDCYIVPLWFFCVVVYSSIEIEAQLLILCEDLSYFLVFVHQVFENDFSKCFVRDDFGRPSGGIVVPQSSIQTAAR